MSRDPESNESKKWNVCLRIPFFPVNWVFWDALYCKHHLGKIIINEGRWRNLSCKKILTRESYLEKSKNNKIEEGKEDINEINDPLYNSDITSSYLADNLIADSTTGEFLAILSPNQMEKYVKKKMLK